MENRIKDCQLDLFADRMSAHAYKANQVPLIFAAFAYVLIDGIRRFALKNSALANAVPSTIRLKLLKIGARVVNSVRRIKLSLPDACPGKTLFFKAHAALAPPQSQPFCDNRKRPRCPSRRNFPHTQNQRSQSISEPSYPTLPTLDQQKTQPRHTATQTRPVDRKSSDTKWPREISGLDARAAHPSATLADLYDPDLMPPNLRRAHQVLDRAVDRLYRRAGFASERTRVEHLFMLYEKMRAPLEVAAQGKLKRRRALRSRHIIG